MLKVPDSALRQVPAERLKKSVGHNLVKTAQWVIAATGSNPLKPATEDELANLSRLYQNHLLRYGSVLDVLIAPSSIPAVRVLRRMTAVVRLTDGRLGFRSPPAD